MKLYDENRESRKRAELEAVAHDGVLKYWKESGLNDDTQKAMRVATEIMSSFVEITAPETEIAMKMLTLSHGGREGGSSTKPGNLFLNFRKLVTAVAAGGLTVTGILGPWTALFAALVIWDSVWSGLHVKISEREAALLWAMWRNCDLNNHITEDKILKSVNEELESNGRPQLSSQEMQDSLAILARMSCIERVSSIENEWWLCEWVRKSYK